eukprot:1828437-Lingulodinium_polyedra.AAC.1
MKRWADQTSAKWEKLRQLRSCSTSTDAPSAFGAGSLASQCDVSAGISSAPSAGAGRGKAKAKGTAGSSSPAARSLPT